MGLPLHDPQGCDKVSYEESYRIAMLERQRLRRLEQETAELEQLVSRQQSLMTRMQQSMGDTKALIK